MDSFAREELSVTTPLSLPLQAPEWNCFGKGNTPVLHLALTKTRNRVAESDGPHFLTEASETSEFSFTRWPSKKYYKR